MQLQTDVLIIGAGPAGATLARALPASISVLLVDKRNFGYDSGKIAWQKPCGGLIAPDAQACFFHMGLSIPEKILVQPQIFGVRAIDLESGHEQTFQRHYLNVKREELDYWLFELAVANSNVTPLTGLRLETLRNTPNHVYATLSNGSTIKASVVVGADGASSRVRRLLDKDCFKKQAISKEAKKGFFSGLFTPRRYLAVQYEYAFAQRTQEFGAFFHQAVTDYYSWSIPKENTLLVGTALPWPGDAAWGQENAGKRVSERFSLLIESLNKYGYGLHTVINSGACALVRPSARQHFPLGSGRVLLVGEAAGLISPSSAEGVSYAFRSAMSLAAVLKNIDVSVSASGTEDRIVKLYAKRLASLQRQLRLKTIKSILIYHPQLRRIVLGSRLGSFSADSLW